MFTMTQKVVVWILPLLFAITLHEAAHALMAYRCGDVTAKRLGRLSLNPWRHVDLFGTILLPITLAFLTNFQFVFGWAKPVPIDWRNLRHPRRDSVLVAAAGPLANFLMCLVWATCLKLSTFFHPDVSSLGAFLLLSGLAGVWINLILGCVNLLPIPPLDGSRIIAGLLSPKYAFYYLKIEPFGFIILVILLFSGALGWLLSPVLSAAFSFLEGLFRWA